MTIAQKFYYFLAGLDQDRSIETTPQAWQYFNDQAGGKLRDMSDVEFEESLKRVMPDHIICFCEPDEKTKRLRSKITK